MTNESMFERAGRLFFTRDNIRDLEKQINTAGIGMPADSFAGYLAINVIVVTIFLTFVLYFYPPVIDSMVNLVAKYLVVPTEALFIPLLIVSFIVTYIATMSLLSTYLIMKAEDRRNSLESTLPDFLTLVASNIKAGMTLDQAMWYSAKPEFGILSVEVKAGVKEAFSGESLAHTLDGLASRFDSKVFKRTILLLKKATATGGELTEVLERTTDDVRNNIITKKDIAASLVLYEIFILFAAIVGTPFLFAVAAKLIEVFEKISPRVGDMPTTSGGPFMMFSNMQFSGPIISSSDF
ncbi:hypothetical protein COZ60_01685, partial [Candidatus Bathyarchaeota archaeon CG_4_8_14_3_um_filter_42_8]